MLVVIIIDLVIAAIAGWLAGKIMNFSKRPLGNILLGILGGIVGSIVFGVFGLHGAGIIGSIIVSVLGACLIIFIARLLSIGSKK